MKWQLLIYDFLTYAVFTYSVVLLIFYVLIAIFSTADARHYLRKNSFTDYRTLVSSPHVPSLSILAPAYNEGATIIENVRSLLSINYSNMEVLIINDGSKDDTIEKLVKAYDLKKVDFFVCYQVPTKEVRGVYKSTNPVYKKLVVIDKVNGGKADALNVGVNIASNDYIICIDVDCILEQDALLKLVKPFIEETKVKVIATGGVVRIANSCVVEHGKLLKVRLPEQYLPRMQVLEYIRAFLLGRMAWSRLNGLLLISGAFGAFDKEIVIKCGGYNHNTVGEDMELVVRMRRYMEEAKIPYKVAFIPDPLCWTEAPASFKILGRQRNRWTRGTIETLQLHKKMFFNPKYGILGLLSYPYWFFFEMCAPVIEFLGFIAFLVMTFLGVIDWSTFALFLLFIISFGYTYSAFAVFIEVLTYNQYKRRTDVMKLLLIGLTEPFRFHPFVVWHGVMGYIDLLRKKKSWGEMTRQGFNSPTQPAAATPTTNAPVAESKTAIAAPEPIATTTTTPATQQPAETSDGVRRPGLTDKLLLGLRAFTAHWIALAVIFMLIRAAEMFLNIRRHGEPTSPTAVWMLGFVKDIGFLLQYGSWLLVPFLLFYLLHKKLANGFMLLVATGLLLMQTLLAYYFVNTLVPLGADLWGYSWAEIRQTVGASGTVNIITFVVVLVLLAAFVLLMRLCARWVRPSINVALVFTVIILAAFAVRTAKVTNQISIRQEYANNLATNKSFFFIWQSWEHFHPSYDLDIYSDEYSGETARNSAVNTFDFIDENKYPFLHRVDTTSDVLAPFFHTATTKPNIVFVIVEGLGRSFSNSGATLGSFTPFIDSLSAHSLYWENFLSASGRTFGVLPSLTASLPFGKSGFAELGNDMPPHQSLMSILKQYGYQSNFYYGGNADFDNMHLFLQRNGVTVTDEKTFPAGYKKMPASAGFTWGYGDQELMRRYLSATHTTPYCNIILTVSTHSPFLINEQAQYQQRFESRLRELNLDPALQTELRRYQAQFLSILYADDAVRQLISGYEAKPEFNNTIFIITGDHRMPEIPMSSKADRYHVPFLIYSPLLARTGRFSSVSSHLDVTPTLLNWLRRYGITPPNVASWTGSGIDTARSFRNVHAIPLMQTKVETVDYVDGNYWLNQEQLYRITPSLDLELQNDPKKLKALQAAFRKTAAKNQALGKDTRLLP